MLKRQEQAIEKVIRLRAGVDEAKRRVNVEIYHTVRVQGVPVRELAKALRMTRSRVYQIMKEEQDRLDQ